MRAVNLAVRALLCLVLATAYPALGIAKPHFLRGGVEGPGSAPISPDNTLTLKNVSLATVTNYPLQFARPFICGAVANYPQAVLDGTPVATQVDVKKRCPDGSVQHAVMSLIVPSLLVNTPVVLSFQDQASGNNTPLTKVQMQGAGYNFDAKMSLAFPGIVEGVPNNTIATWKAITSGSMRVTVDGTAYQLTGLNFSAIQNMNEIYQKMNAAAIAAGYPVRFYNVMSSSAPPIYSSVFTTGSGSAVVVTTATTGTDLKPMLFTTTQTQRAPSTAIASARTMLSADQYKLWTSGQIAQTIELSDDTVARAYDLGNGDGFKPFRPRFFATFWPGINKIQVRYVGENGLTSGVEDLAYFLSLTLGNTSPTTVYSIDLTGGSSLLTAKRHYSRSNWTKRYWIGGAPEDKINIDNNLAYLTSTRAFPNFDTNYTITESAIASMSSNYTTKNNDMYDGQWNVQSTWHEYMGETGARIDISPYVGWNVLWLYSGDYRMRVMSQGLADIASAWQMNLREDDPTRIMSRDDAPGTGTAFGHFVSIAGRKKIYTVDLRSSYTVAGDKVPIVGPTQLEVYENWQPDSSHEPSPFYPLYMLTGDPYYLQMMFSWAAHDSALTQSGRGTAGTFGAIFNQLRGAGWIVRSRAETAFAAPDGTPEQHYFQYMTNDALAIWEAGFGITGTPFDGASSKSLPQPDLYSGGAAPYNGVPPPLHNWESNPGLVHDEEVGGKFITGVAGTATSPWMQWFALYGVSRAVDLGFAARPVLSYSAKYLADIVLTSGHPELVQTYRNAVEKKAGGWMTFPEIIATFTPGHLAGKLAIMTGSVNGEAYFEYTKGPLAVMVDAGITDALATWEAMSAYYANVTTWNGYQAVWNIKPREDTNALPAMPTTIPPLAVVAADGVLAGWPNSTNTGYKKAPGYPGSLHACSTIVSNTTYSYCDFTGIQFIGSVDTPVTNVTFYGSRFRSSDDAAVVLFGENITFDYCSLEPAGTSAPPVAYAQGYQYGIAANGGWYSHVGKLTVTHSDIWGFANAIDVSGSTQATPHLFRDNWVHDARADNDLDHTDGIGEQSGFTENSYVTLDHNSILSNGNTQGIAYQGHDGYNHFTVTNNYLSGFGYTVAIGVTTGIDLNTNILFSGNVFGTNIMPRSGPLYGWSDGTGNAWKCNYIHFIPGTTWTTGNGWTPVAGDDRKFWLPLSVSATDYLGNASCPAIPF